MKAYVGRTFAALLLFGLSPALADTFTVQGYVANPTGPDSSPSTNGYDNGGFFGPQFANLGGLPFTVTWTGTDCNCYGGLINVTASPLTGATLTINGATVNLLPFGTSNIFEAEWFSNVLQVETTSSVTTTLPYPPFTTTTTYYGSEDRLTTWSANDVGPNMNVGGGFALQDAFEPAYLPA
jgi:hypothetical protein